MLFARIQNHRKNVIILTYFIHWENIRRKKTTSCLLVKECHWRWYRNLSLAGGLWGMLVFIWKCFHCELICFAFYRCSGKVGLCPAVYLSKSFPSKKLAFQRSTLQHASTIYGFPTNISPPQPTFQRSHSIRKSPERNHSHTIGFNASQTKIPPPRKR